MKPTFRETCIRAHDLYNKNVGFPEIAKRLKLPMVEQAYGLVKAGEKIVAAESYRLTDNEMLVMRALVRAEIRAIETDKWPPKTKDVDFAAGKRSGWCAKIIEPRLRMAHEGEPSGNRIGLLYVGKSTRAIWLTPPGWAFAWDAGLILENWKVPA